MPLPFRTTRRVEFRDTDAAGLMHFSTFFVLMEEVEHEFLRSLGLSVFMRDEAGPVTWPRVATSCEFVAPVKFEDVLNIELRVARVGRKSVTYEFTFSREGRTVALGKMSAVCCRIAGDGVVQSMIIPEWIAAKLR